MGKTRDLFKKIRDTKGTFHAKMGTIEDRNGLHLTEAEDIKKRWKNFKKKRREKKEKQKQKKKRWQQYTENCTKKIFMIHIIMMV